MRPGGGRGKGFGFEIEISRQLTTWLTGKPKPEVFWRSTGSGGTAEHSRKKGQATHVDGDIMAIHESATVITDHLFFECKRYKKCDVFESFFFGKGQTLAWWTKLLRQAKQAGKEPLLIIKADRSPTLLLIRSEFISALVPNAGDVYFNIWEYNLEVCVCLLKDFLHWVDVDAFKLWCEVGQR